MGEWEGTAKYPGQVRNGKLLFLARGFYVPHPVGPLGLAGVSGNFFFKPWMEDFPRERNKINGCRKILEMSERYFSGAGKKFLHWKLRRLYQRSERYLNGTFSRKPVNRYLKIFKISPERLWLCLESRSCLVLGNLKILELPCQMKLNQ